MLSKFLFILQMCFWCFLCLTYLWNRLNLALILFTMSTIINFCLKKCEINKIIIVCYFTRLERNYIRLPCYYIVSSFFTFQKLFSNNLIIACDILRLSFTLTLLIRFNIMKFLNSQRILRTL